MAEAAELIYQISRVIVGVPEILNLGSGNGFDGI